jgi:hypothetical protein
MEVLAIFVFPSIPSIPITPHYYPNSCTWGVEHMVFSKDEMIPLLL